MSSPRVGLGVGEDGSQSKLGVLIPKMGHWMLDRNHPAFGLSCTKAIRPI